MQAPLQSNVKRQSPTGESLAIVVATDLHALEPGFAYGQGHMVGC
jgi:hypothetical protein